MVNEKIYCQLLMFISLSLVVIFFIFRMIFVGIVILDVFRKVPSTCNVFKVFCLRFVYIICTIVVDGYQCCTNSRIV